MPSSWSSSLRFELQFTGENINLWGDKLNTVLSHADYAVAGWLTKALTGDYVLTTANAADDEARAAMLKFTGGAGPFTVTIPSVSKSYAVWNACSGLVIITTGAGTTATIQSGEVVSVICDGSNVKRVQGTDFGGAQITSVADPTTDQMAATKKYVDDTAFDMAAGALPGQGGNAGKFVKTDGSSATWDYVATTDVQGFSASAAAVRTGTSTSAALTPGDTYNALTEQVFTFGSTITPDFSLFLNGVVNMTGNVTLANPTNVKPGQSGRIRFVQDATGSRTLTVGANWKRSGGALALSTTANAIDVLVYDAVSATYILYDIIRNPT